MKGVGRTVRENAERSYWGHCYDAWDVMTDIKDWPWRDLWKAAKLVGNFALYASCVVFWPVMVPVAGYCRKKHAKQQLERASSLSQRMFSRVQKQ